MDILLHIVDYIMYIASMLYVKFGKISHITLAECSCMLIEVKTFDRVSFFVTQGKAPVPLEPKLNKHIQTTDELIS